MSGASDNDLACAVLRAIGLDPATVRAFTFRFEAGEPSTFEVEHVAIRKDIGEIERFTKEYDVKVTAK